MVQLLDIIGNAYSGFLDTLIATGSFIVVLFYIGLFFTIQIILIWIYIKIFKYVVPVVGEIFGFLTGRQLETFLDKTLPGFFDKVEKFTSETTDKVFKSRRN